MNNEQKKHTSLALFFACVHKVHHAQKITKSAYFFCSLKIEEHPLSAFCPAHVSKVEAGASLPLKKGEGPPKVVEPGASLPLKKGGGPPKVVEGFPMNISVLIIRKYKL